MEEEIELRPAQFSDRFIAYLLDVGFFIAGWIATLYVVWVHLAKEPPTQESALQLGLLWGAGLLLYQFIGNCLGGTIGKKVMGLAVVSKSGGSLGVVRSFLRAVFYPLSFPLNLGFLLALVHPESRALHDLLSGSLVVEARPKHPSEALVLLPAALLSAAGLLVGGTAWQLSQPLPSDIVAVEKAREGIQILAQIQEKHKAEKGHYTDKLGELAGASGNPESFRESMGEIFDPEQFRIKVDLRGYVISAAARDRKRTRVSVSGP
jgi:uncharacterized RDD family membrane protein YckC